MIQIGNGRMHPIYEDYIIMSDMSIGDALDAYI